MTTITYQNPPNPTATLESVTRPDGNTAEVLVIGDPLSNINAAVKAGNTAAVAADPALVVALSPNNGVKLLDGSGDPIGSTGGSLNVAITGGSTGNAAAGPTGASVPGSADYIGINVAGNLVGVSSSNPLPIIGIVAGAGTAGVPGTAVLTVQGIAGGQSVIISGTVGLSAGSLTVGKVDILGNAGATLDSAVGTPNTQAVTIQGNSSGVAVPVSLASTTITGAVTVSQSATAWIDNLTQWASTTLGAPTNFGTTPGAVIVGSVNSSLFVGTTAVRSNQSTSATGTVDVNLAGVLGTTLSATNGLFSNLLQANAILSTANPIFSSLTDGTTQVTVIAATAALKTDLSSVAGTATRVAAAGVQKVGIVGNTGATIDAAQGGTPPANAIQTSAIAATALPTAATPTDTVVPMADKYGRLVILPQAPRDLVGTQTTSIVNTTAETTIVTQVASTFNDITSIQITNASAIAVSVTIKDSTAGTTRKVYDLAANGGIVVAFPVPLPQATVNTNWTATLSVNTVTVDVNVDFVKNK